MPQWRWGSYSVYLKLIINYWNITRPEPRIQHRYTILAAISLLVFCFSKTRKLIRLSDDNRTVTALAQTLLLLLNIGSNFNRVTKRHACYSLEIKIFNITMFSFCIYWKEQVTESAFRTPSNTSWTYRFEGNTPIRLIRTNWQIMSLSALVTCNTVYLILILQWTRNNSDKCGTFVTG